MVLTKDVNHLQLNHHAHIRNDLDINEWFSTICMNDDDIKWLMWWFESQMYCMLMMTKQFMKYKCIIEFQYADEIHNCMHHNIFTFVLMTKSNIYADLEPWELQREVQPSSGPIQDELKRIIFFNLSFSMWIQISSQESS